MKQTLIVLFSFVWLHLNAQNSEQIIPQEAVTVFSINNISLLQKVTIDELIEYDFMDEIHQELFDGSTDQKSLKDAGIDFDQRLNIFYGKNLKYELSGFTFGLKNKTDLFKVFDDFDAMESPYKNVDVYGSFFNNLIIQNQAAILVRVEPLESHVLEVTDSIWYSRGNLSPYYADFENGEDNPDDNVMNQEIDRDILTKNYNEMRDSVQFILQNAYFKEVMEGLFVQRKSLYSQAPQFQEQLTHTTEGIFYMDNARNFEKTNNLWYLKTVLPSLYTDIQEIYEGNVIVGDLILKDHNIEFQITAKYGEKLGSIYQEMNDSKFDKNITKYIKEDQAAYFTYNINLRKAYEKAFEVIVPILSKEKNQDISMNVLFLKLANEFVNKDALFNAYKGSMFGTFNGIQKVKTKKIEFFYDEVTFEYGERTSEAEEDMPIFTLGFTTDRPDIPELVLSHLSQVTSKFEKKENYWIYNNAIFESAPVYLINKNGLLIVTNDKDLADNHSNGYGAESISKKAVKAIKNSGFMTAAADIKIAASKFPTDFLQPEQQRLIESLKGKSGNMKLTSSDTSSNQTNVSLVYSYEGQENSGKHLLDLLNTMYLLTK
jgi:hypothetical protein